MEGSSEIKSNLDTPNEIETMDDEKMPPSIQQHTTENETEIITITAPEIVQNVKDEEHLILDMITEPSDNEMTLQEMNSYGYYIVDKISKHTRKRKNWVFYCVWQGYPEEQATWEPVNHFVHPNGFINEIFTTYCEDKSKLKLCLKKAFTIANQNRKKSQKLHAKQKQ